MTIVPEATVRAELATAIEAFGGVRKLAKVAGLSPTYVSRCKTGKERVAGDLARFLGFERVTVYRRIRK